MTAKPILFNASMVRAVRDNRKTQTRRPIEPQPPLRFSRVVVMPLSGEASWRDDHAFESWPKCEGKLWARSQYVPGDILWVRETWADGIGRPIYRADWGEPVGDNYPAHPDAKWLSELQRACGADVCKHEWRPSIHMPRWACREWLRVTNTRAERVQDITEEDAKAEGVQTERDYYGGDVPLMCQGSVAWHRYDERPCAAVSARHSFETLWDSTYGPGAWDRNGWVWAYTFERTAKPEGWPNE